MAGPSFDINGARQAGYSDAEITQHLSGMKGFDVDGALKSGYSPTEVLDHLSPQPSGLIDNAREGISEGLSGLGKTIKTYVGDGYGGDTLMKMGANEAPNNFVPTPLYDKEGFHASGILPTLARAAPAAAAGIGAAGLGAAAAPVIGVGAGAGAIAGGVLAGTALAAGNSAQEAADTRTGQPNAPITTADKVRGGAAATLSSIPAAIPVGGYLSKFAGPLAKTGYSGALNAGKKLIVQAADQGAGNAAGNAIDQAVQSVGTKGGLNVDPTQVINAGASGAVTGTAFGAKNAVRESLDASKYKEITPELKPAADMVANRIAQFAGGTDKLQGTFTGNRAAQEAGADAVNKTHAAIQNELGDAVSDLRSRVTLPTDADNVLKAAMSGQMPSKREYGILQSAIAADPQAANVTNLLQQAHVLDMVKSTGTLSDGRFVGGVAGKFTHILSPEHLTKTAIGAAAGAALEGGAGHIIAYSPHVLGAAGVGMLGAKALDNLTGAQAPAGRFTRNFGDGTTNVRLAVPQQPAAPSAPVGPQGPQAPLAGPPRPWSSPQAAQALLATQRGNAANAAALPLLKQLAAQSKPPAVPPVAGGSIITPQVQAHMDSLAAIAKLAAAKRAAAPVPVEPAAPKMTGVVPADVLRNTKAIVAGLRTTAKTQAVGIGQNAANSEVTASPFIQQLVGGAENVPTPQASAAMSKALSGARALAKLRSDPEAEAEEAAQAKVAKVPEKITAAAIRHGDGQVFTGANHASIFNDPKYRYDGSAVDGFMTNKGRFVDRVEANKIAGNVGTGMNGVRQPTLTAEDLKPTTVTKTNGTTQHNDDPFAPSSYAHMPAAQAADAITKAAHSAGNVKYANGFRAATQARIQGERDVMSRINAEVPGLPIAELTARLEGRSNQTDAKAYRDHLKTTYPQAAASIDRHLSDEAIKQLWKKK